MKRLTGYLRGYRYNSAQCLFIYLNSSGFLVQGSIFHCNDCFYLGL